MSELPVQPQEGENIGPGAMLARARAERGLNIAEVAEHIKYRIRQIEALEADDYRRLPESTIVRGMIRGYVKFVGLDPAPFLKALDRYMVPTQANVDLRTRRIPFPDGNKRATRLYVALSIIVLLAIIVVLYEWHFSVLPPPTVVSAPPTRAAPAPAIPARASTVVSAAPTKPAMPAGALTPAAPARPLVPAAPVMAEAPVATPSAEAVMPSTDGMPRIQFQFQRESWVEIKDRAGKILLSQLNSAGTQKVVEGEPPFSVTIGNAAGVRVTYKGVPVDLKQHMKSDVARLTLE
ncbi:MAG: hypothetical protein A3H32_03275 [Betaproteobacteria bacterium RIFCSPLOWO2_02_FULL_63_19]|nr:MAG: hypothetical protein A3H32_03275 [Betaproteobacteria bacterium RIFCSPLOWO2_02_FULL_63_19]